MDQDRRRVVTRRGTAPRRARRRRPTALSAYALGVGALGTATALAVICAGPSPAALGPHWVPLCALALGLVLGELVPVPVARGNSVVGAVTVSGTFAVALVLLGPLSVALAVQTAAVLIDDARNRRAPVQVLFNCGQYAVSLVAARAVFCAASGAPLLGGFADYSGADLLAGLAAGATFAVVNHSLVVVVAALATRRPIGALLVDDLGFNLETSGVLVALGPAAAILVETNALMLVLLVLPVLAVRRTALLAALRERQALHDPLTGLANRELFRRRVASALEAQRDRGAAVLLLDLDHFKDVNDTLGHDVGDELLRQVAIRVEAATEGHGDDAVVARLGGDEFAVLLVAHRPEDTAVRLADQLLADLSAPVAVAGTRLSVQASIGITTTDGGRVRDVHSALKEADIALYEAKEERARARVYLPGSSGGSAERLLLLPQLREAIGRGELTVAYQPQVDTATGRVVAVEALVRWDHPTLGRLSPAAFVDLAESAGMIASITTFVLGEALDAAARWHRAGFDVGVAVNLSARQLSDLDLPDHVAALLARAGVPASALTVEVTENSLMSDPRAARTILRALRDAGVRLAIDDFGTGYSSLVLLQQLDVDELKVDRSFVTGLQPGGHDEVLVRSIIELGHNLGLAVVGEGVETPAVAAQLRRLGCDRLQGYHLGRPVEADAVEALLTEPPFAEPPALPRPRLVTPAL